jgi:hypothetical protein
MNKPLEDILQVLALDDVVRRRKMGWNGEWGRERLESLGKRLSIAHVI